MIELLTNQICFTPDGVAVGWPVMTVVFFGLWIRVILKRKKD